MSTGKSRPGRALITTFFAGLPLGAAALVGVSYFTVAALPPVPVPPQNPITEQKRILGKILFFDEQLSSSNTVSCATCHTMSRAGADARAATNPGPDGVIGTPDDRQGSPGVVRSDADNLFTRDPVYQFQPQITPRAANTPINAAYAIDLFWDGRASHEFMDPETGDIAIPNGGALESQSVGPPVNGVEMGHDGTNWEYITTKLAHVTPLQLASNLPPDIASKLASKPKYPQLFAEAFGDSQITAQRIAFAIATYERTLISDETPFDRSRAGIPNALTPGQQAGFNTFQQNCVACHSLAGDLLTDHSFRNIGLRPATEDRGRQIATGNIADRGKFKVPGLRNVGLKRTFMHNGQFTSLTDVARFYARAPGAPQQFQDNLDPALNAIAFPPQAEAALVDFLANALLDPRVRDQQFPFDRPTLFSERPNDRSTLQGGGVAGINGIPNIIANGPAFVGNEDFRVGVFNARTGAQAKLYVSLNPPVAGQITLEHFVGSATTGAVGGTAGVATVAWSLTPGVVSSSQVYYAQWLVTDPAAPSGIARSVVSRIPIFCGSAGCPSACGTSDFNNDGDYATDADIEAFFACLAGDCCPTCFTSDFNADGDYGTDADIESFFRVLAGGNC